MLPHRWCHHNDTNCGKWNGGRFFQPYDCFYFDISSEMARKCLGNRTLAFIGDSQIRDIGTSVWYFLFGRTLDESPDEKYDKNTLVGESEFFTVINK